MDIYMVGGAVRDLILGEQPKDVDYVVVGATPEDMTARGFEQVGAAFPVFLHPVTGAEYALARTERKTGPGYHGFGFSTQNVTIEEDLKRRDLTMNAMAIKLDADGKIPESDLLGKGSYVLIDPYGGLHDLEAGCLRHVSEAFAEDPLRVLRVARFAARYGFTVAPETLELMTRLVQSGELNTVSYERFWKETDRALTEKHPERYFEVLDRVGALGHLNARFFFKLFPSKTDVRVAVESLRTYRPNPIVFYGYALNAKLSDKQMQEYKVRTEVTRLARAWKALDGLIEDGLFAAGSDRFALRIETGETRESVCARELSKWFRSVHTEEQFLQVMDCLLVKWPDEGGKYFVTTLIEARTAHTSVRAEHLLKMAPGLRGPALGKAIEERRVIAIAASLSDDLEARA